MINRESNDYTLRSNCADGAGLADRIQIVAGRIDPKHAGAEIVSEPYGSIFDLAQRAVAGVNGKN